MTKTLNQIIFFIHKNQNIFFKIQIQIQSTVRDRPFNLQGRGGGEGGGYGLLFHSENLFRTTQEFEYLFFCRARHEIFLQNLTLGYMTKTLNQIIFFSLHQNQNIFFSNIGNQNIFLEKNHNPNYCHLGKCGKI